jgi:RHS repeat-associated protein
MNARRTRAITRDATGRATSVTTKQTTASAAENIATAISYHPMSDMVGSLTHGNGLVTNATHDLDERLTQLQLLDSATLVQGFAYAYADGMNLTGITDQLVAANSNTLSYSPANRLASASGAWGSAAYSYDPVGNRVNDIVTGTTNTSRVASYATTSNRITGMTSNAAAFRSYTGACPRACHRHDPGNGAGNILTDVRPGETFAYAYNNRNRLSSVTRNAAAWGTYIYNGMEQLVSRVSQSPAAPVGTIHYIYDLDGHLIAEANGSTGAITRVYIWLPANDNRNDTLAEDILGAANDNSPDMPLAVVDIAGTTHTLLQVHTDHLGRPTRMTNAAKATVWSATYKPWGEVQAITGSATQNLRFPGQYFQIETGLAYNWHRAFDPITGRYTQPDPLGFVDGPSVYAYAGSSPYMNVDRKGLDMAIVVGAPTGTTGNPGQSGVGNPFGHVGVGITDHGVFSPGTDTAPGSSFTDYLNNQSQYRSSTIFVLPTSKKVDQCVAAVLAGQTEGLPAAPSIAALNDNCSTRVSDALKKCGIKIPTLNLPAGFIPWALANGIPFTNAPQGQSIPGFESFNPK